ncbi:DUF5683 domain-containing protein [Candidatus Riflebacteria bacterium]
MSHFNLRFTAMLTISLFFLGSALAANNSSNPSYSERYDQKYEYEYKNPNAAVALSFLIPGGGQFYNEEYAKGVAFLVTSIGAAAAAFSDNQSTRNVGIGFYVVLWLGSMFDGYFSAQRINRHNGFSLGYNARKREVEVRRNYSF